MAVSLSGLAAHWGLPQSLYCAVKMCPHTTVIARCTSFQPAKPVQVNTVEWEWDWCDLEGRLWDSSMLLEYSIWISMHFMYFIFIRILVISYSNVFMLKFLIQFFLMSTSRSRTFFVAVAYSFHFQLNLENNLNFEIKGTYSFILEI